MFRGKNRNSLAFRALTSRFFLAVIAFMMLAYSYPAASQNSRSEDVVNGDLVAPGLEEHASYFSEDRSSVSKEALKKADIINQKTIASIESLLDSKKPNVRQFELLLRLGELYVERHDYLRDVELDNYAKAFDAWEKMDEKSRGEMPSPNFSASTAQLTRGANSFRKLVSDFPKHPRTDAALFSLAKTLARLGTETSVNYYKLLLKSHPRSPLVPDTYLALGEYYFEKHQVQEAINYYKKVMKFKDHKVYPYAVYKLGWAFYNLQGKNEKEIAQNYKKATTAFKLVIKLADLDKKRGKSTNLNLREEAIKDLIMVWADAEDVASAWAYFKTIGEEESFYNMLERLGNIYFEKGKKNQAITVYARLLKEAPRRKNNPTIHAKLAELHDHVGQQDHVVEDMRAMQRLYLNKSVWMAANHRDKEAVADAAAIVEKNIHRYGALFHQRGQKAKNKAYLKAAAEIYGLYLESFENNPNSYDIRYYLADIQYEFKMYEAASQNFMIVAKQVKGGKYEKPAALNAVAAINQLVSNTKFAKVPPAGQVTQPLAVPRQKKLLVSTIDDFIVILPTVKEGHPMRFSAAQVFFDYGHYEEAIKRFETITKVIPETKQAKASVKLVLGYFAEKQDWEKLVAWSMAFQGNKKVMDKELDKFVADMLRNGTFKHALAYEKAKEFEKAAKTFMDFQKQFPHDPNADRALYNASLNFYKVGEVEAAIGAGNLILSQYPKSIVVPETLSNLGTTYESLAQFDDAAKTYRRFAISYPKDKRAAAALFNAGVLYRGIHNHSAAIKAFQDFGRRYKKDTLYEASLTELATLYEQQKMFEQAISTYGTLASITTKNPDRHYYALAKAAVIEKEFVSRSRGRRSVDSLAKKLRQKNAPTAYDAREVLAQSLFTDLEAPFKSFMAMKVTDGSKIEKQVSDKQAALVKLASDYERLVDLSSPEFVVASLYRLGQAHDNFASALFSAPVPAGANQAEVDAIKTELEKAAFPLREEASKFFEVAYRRSKEVQTFTVWTQRTYQKMVELAPDKYPQIAEIGAEPTYYASEIKVSSATSHLIVE